MQMDLLANRSPWVILLATAIYGLVHTVMASLPFKDMVYTLFGKAGERYYRLFFNVFSTITLLPILALPYALPDEVLYTVPEPWTYLTIALQLLSLLLLTYSVVQTGAFQFAGFSQALGLKTEDDLNTAGLYRFVRHPLYTFSMLFLWLAPTMTRNQAILYFSFTLYFIIGAVFEERKLVKIFGDDYRRYQAATPMLVPFLKWGRGSRD